VVLLLIAGLGASALGVRAWLVAARQTPGAVVETESREWDDDLLQDYVSARALREGIDPYEGTGKLTRRTFGPGSSGYQWIPDEQINPHPPAFILVTVPLSFLDYRTARLVWLFAMALLASSVLFWLARTLGASRGAALSLGIGALFLPISQADLWFGQSNALILSLVIASWLSLRKGRDRIAGATLGVAIALRFFPALLLLPLVRMRRWRSLGWAAGAVGVVSVLSVWAVGAEVGKQFTEVAHSNFGVWGGAPMNLSLVAVPFRWLTQNEWRAHAMDLPLLATILSGMMFALCMFGAWRTPARRSGDVFLATFPFMLLASPLFWNHYMILLIPLGMVMVQQTMRRGVTPVLTTVALALVAIGEPPILSGNIITVSNIGQIFGYGFPMLAVLVLLASDFITPRSTGATAPVDGVRARPTNARDQHLFADAQSAIQPTPAAVAQSDI
jgi:hypothetical protein